MNRSPAPRRRGALAGAAALVLLLGTVATPPAGAAGGDRATLQRQVDALRHTVRQLQRRVRTLEARPMPTAPTPTAAMGVQGPTPARSAHGATAPAAHTAPPAATPRTTGTILTPQIKANWGALKRGMNADRVRALLGAPSRRLEINDGQPLWYYYYTGTGGGSVMFSRDGVVSDWQHPPFGRLW
jgi:hypothetical protein